MNPDGSGKTALPEGASSFANGEPSRGLHAGRRWYLSLRQIAGETYPGSTIIRRELFAVRDDGAVAVQLTTQADLMPTPDAINGSGARWSPDDSIVSWSAKRWAGGASGAWQIYAAGVVFDGSGNVTGLASQPASPASALADAISHDWSPDGARLVVSTGPGPGALSIAYLGSGAAAPLATSTDASMPAWSPDGRRIAYVGNDGTVRTIAPDGSGERIVVSRKRDLDVSFRFPKWSPHGTHLAYERRDILGRQDVWRVAADGAGAANLTSGLNTSVLGGNPASPLGWR
jgi:hypothetical protein